jgi:hypothetical protein
MAIAAMLAAFVLMWGYHFATGRSPFPLYVLLANYLPAGTFGNWLLDRTYSVLNTLVPFHMVAFFSSDPNINANGAVSPPLVRLYFSYWNTLPFAIGLVVFFPWCVWMARLAKRFAGVFLVAIVIPFLLFAIYWGATHSGLMREGLHPWYFTLFLFLVWGASRTASMDHGIAAALRRVHVLRTVELLAMLLATTVLTNFQLVNPKYALTDAAALVTIVGSSIALGWLTWRIVKESATAPAEPGAARPQQPSKARKPKR